MSYVTMSFDDYNYFTKQRCKSQGKHEIGCPAHQAQKMQNYAF